MKGIIFDFNGTMFQDSHLHEEAWIFMIHKYAKGELSDEDILKNIHGRTNNEILNFFISNSLSNDKIAALSYEKEAYYRELCKANEDALILTDGLEQTLDNIVKHEIPMTIATATVKENVDFYFDVFKLNRWFDIDKVIYDNGSFPGKPQPDIFLHAAKILDLQPNECLVIEDAYSGLLAAQRAGIATIVAIDPERKNRSIFLEANLCQDGLITNFINFWHLFIEKNIDKEKESGKKSV